MNSFSPSSPTIYGGSPTVYGGSGYLFPERTLLPPMIREGLLATAATRPRAREPPVATPVEAAQLELVHTLEPRSTAIDFSAEPITIKVGSPPRTFRADAKVLCATSEFFKAALKKDWTEGQTRIVELPEEIPVVFNTYLNWRYRHKICLDINDDQTREKNTDYFGYIRGYALGDMLMDIEYKDAITDAFLAAGCIPDEDRCAIVPGVEAQRFLYSATSDTSLLRKLIVHRMTMPGCPGLLEADTIPQFLLDVAQKLAERDPDDIQVAAAKCRFHEHPTGKEHCYRTKC